MSRKRIDPNAAPGSDGDPYDVAVFAEKHGISEKAATVILKNNWLSRNKCDAAAKAFKEALAARSKS